MASKQFDRGSKVTQCMLGYACDEKFHDISSRPTAASQPCSSCFVSLSRRDPKGVSCVVLRGVRRDTFFTHWDLGSNTDSIVQTGQSCLFFFSICQLKTGANAQQDNI